MSQRNTESKVMNMFTMLFAALFAVALSGCFGSAVQTGSDESEVKPSERTISYTTANIPGYGTCTFAYLKGHSDSMTLIGCRL